MSKKITKNVRRYVERHRRQYQTKDFIFDAYNPPNTMFKVANELPLILLQLPNNVIRLYLFLLTLLKRNPDIAKACTVQVAPIDVVFMSRNTFYKCINILHDKELVLKTDQDFTYIINIQYANKLYSPKPEI